MHLIVGARGQRDRLNQWENDLNNKAVPYIFGKVHGEAGKSMGLNNGGEDITGLYQLNVQPIRFYSINFPEPATQDVLGMINPQKPWNKKLELPIKLIQKSMKLDPIPEFKAFDQDELMKTGKMSLVLNRKSIECFGLGMKKDLFKNGIEQV